MAYTKTPAESTHQIARINIEDLIPQYQDIMYTEVGYPTTDPIRSAETLFLNCLPRKQQNTMYLEPLGKMTNSSVNTSSFTSGQHAFFIPTMFSSHVGLYHASSAGVWKGNTQIITYPATCLWTHFIPANLAGIETVLVVAGNDLNSYVYTIINSTAAVSGPTTLNGIVSIGNPVFFNSRLYVLDKRTQRIYNSAVGAPLSFSLSTDFIEAEMIGDVAYSLEVHKNCLVVFGASSIEFFKDVAYSIGSPLLREESSAAAVGLAYNGFASWWIPEVLLYYHKPLHAKYGNTIFFVGFSESGIGIYKIQDFKVTKLDLGYFDRYLNERPEWFPISFLPFHYNGRFLLCLSFSGGPRQSYMIDPLTEAICRYTYDESGPFSSAYYIMQTQIPPLNTLYSGVTDTFFALVFDTVAAEVKLKVFKRQDTSLYTDTTLSSSVTFPAFDGGNHKQKHIKTVDVIGLFGKQTTPNVYTLSYVHDAASNPTTTVPASDSSGGLLRFRNLGRGRRTWITLSIDAGYFSSIRAIEITYNLGTH